MLKKYSKDWIQTYSGRQFWPYDPRPEDVSIIDIAHALSLKCRYSGHCLKHYSVAEHSYFVSKHVVPGLELWGLLHDAAESWLPDVPRPIKQHLTGFHEIEAKVMQAVCVRFGLPFDEPADVKRVDNAILADEMSQNMAPTPAEWVLHEPPLGITLPFWSPQEANLRFLERFLELTDR